MRWSIGVAVTAVLLLSGCDGQETRSPPQPTLRATSTAGVATEEPTLPPTVESAVEELFWLTVDAAGLDRSLDFEDAKWALADVLFIQYDDRLVDIEEFGISPFEEWPFCINAIAGAYAISSLQTAASPLEAAPYANDAVEVLFGLDTDLKIARAGERGQVGPQGKARCDEFDLELSELYGPLQ